MVTLVVGDSGYEKFMLVLEVLRKQLEPKSYLTTDNPQNICERVTTTAFEEHDNSISWLYCMLFDTCRCDLFHVQ